MVRSLLITGASGFVGWYVCRHFATRWQVYGTYCRHVPVVDAGILPYAVDLTCDRSLQAAWDALQPDAVLHLAAIAKVNQCQQDPTGSRALNITAAVHLAALCAQRDIPFLFTSTDLVFDGTQAPYAETALPQAVNEYGRQKAIAEAAIREVYPAATIVRLPLLYGAPTPHAECFLQGFLRAIAAGKTLTLFTDEVRTPAAVTDIVQGIDLLLQQGQTGIWHLGGPERINRYAFGLQMAAAFHVDSTLMQPCLQSSVALPAPRPQDVSLNSAKAFALGYAPQAVAPALVAIAARESDHPTDSAAQSP